MADTNTKEAVTKLRVINHMNADHQDSLVRYLEHYNKLSSFSARNARLEDISLDSLTISSSKGVHHLVPFDPPLTSWSEIRARVVAMDMESLEKLKRSDVTVKKYIRPNRAWQFGVFMLVVWVCIVFPRRSNFLPGSTVYDTFAMLNPSFARFSSKVRLLTLYSMLSIHAAEALYMANVKLAQHSVPRFSMLWWQWFLSCFCEGGGSFVRFNELVRNERVKKKKAQH